MLGIKTKRKLNAQNWEEVNKRYKNINAAVADFKVESKAAIDDLILLAGILPNTEQEEIFSYENIERFIQAILKGSKEGLHSYSRGIGTWKGKDTSQDIKFNNRILHIAAILVKEGTKVCIEQYAIGRNPILNEPIIRILKEAAALCYAIAFPFRVTKSSTLKYNVERAQKSE